ncbi:hypothetical protein B0J13DRAFT_590959 [Dactylonectria estremocensis]|uniref:Uncharacterized protein n=1 Tax=Dactylonectria estremocensis TaxID=1079267 RepID=A0A9P9D2W0_9HYPO|nr:hypothetical protein B0J13DRAFT_590959 [Dactylonectria estremocensis]
MYFPLSRRLPVRETIDALSPKYSHNVIGSTRSLVNKGEVPVLFVLDDDPTGTQTYHDIDANKMAAEAASQTFEIVLRGDSTLRGHLPEEPKAAEEALSRFNGLIMTLKCGKRLNESSFVPVTLQDIRVGGPASSASILILGAAAESDIHTFIAGLLEAEKSGRQYPYRTGAAFVLPRPGITGIPQLTLADLGVSTKILNTRRLPGSLIMAGSLLIKGQDTLTSLSIGSQVAKALVQLSGITSLDAATKGLKMRRARVLGQAAPGAPLRRCDEETSRHRVVPYMVFPGSVGRDQTRADVVEAWSTDGSG